MRTDKNNFFDYIIIGSGIAGLNSALNATTKGKVLLITKKKLADSNTRYAQGGIASVLGQTDHFKKHLQDTLKAGRYHNNKKAVEFIIKNGPAAIRKLIKLGVTFSQTAAGEIELSLEGGHREKRIIHVGDYTGKAIEEALIKNVKKNSKITVLEHAFVKDLLVKNGTCHGVQIIKRNRCSNFFARAVIMASGGLGQVYLKTTNPQVTTGDGLAMAHRAGCKLKDLEFIQFHPTALNQKSSPLFLLSEALRGEGARLINHKGERFMLNKNPLAELAPRDIVSQESFEQKKKGQVFLDLCHLNQAMLKKKYPQIMAKLASLKIDSAKQPIPVTPAAHYSCGGVKTDLKGATNVKNLYAIGEVACTGLHGANRLASNSLLEAAVMSEQIAKLPLPKNSPDTNFHQAVYKKQPSTQKIRAQLKKIMWQYVGVVRTQKGLRQAKKKLSALSKNLPKPTDIQSCETQNLLTTAILITKAAFARKKSLGTHFLK